MSGGYSSGKLSIAICARCGLKHQYRDLKADGDKGWSVRVCDDDNDVKDPWKLPAIKPEAISLQFPRPDVSIATNPRGLISEDQHAFLTDEAGQKYLVP